MPIIKDSSGSDSELDSLYSEEEPDSSAKPSGSTKEPEVEEHTELISSKLIKDKEVKKGDRIVLTVVKSYGNEVEVKYGSEKSEKPDMSEDEELDALSA